MTNSISRRAALRALSMAAAAATAAGALPNPAAAAAGPNVRRPAGTTVVPAALRRPGRAAAADRIVNGLPVPDSWKIHPFDLDQVSLQPSLFTANRDRILHYAKGYSPDRIVSNFRRTAGLDTRGAQPPGGWDDATGNLRGHYSGHFMTLLAQAYAGSGEAVYKDNLDYIVTALGECQDALAARVGEPAPPAPPATWKAGKFGGALTLSGDGQYVGLPDATIDGLDDFTAAIWVNLTENRTWSRVFDFGTGTRVYMFLTANAGGGPRFAITTSGGSGEQVINGVDAVATGEWTHLAVTKQGNVGTLYVNGEAVGTNQGMTLGPVDLGAPKNNWIGKSQYGDPNLAGSIDEFQLFDRALPAAEIGSLTAGPAGAAGGNVVNYAFDEQAGTAVADASGNNRDGAVVTGSGGDPGPSFPGYLAAYPETQFILLEQYTTYPAIWAPYYTCHKIMRGLIDAYALTGNQQALEIVTGMGRWVHSRLSKLPREQLDRMWSIYIAGEYGGMNEVMADLYALTGNVDFLDTAKCFDNTALLAACVQDNDILDGKHANQHIPQFVGYLRVYDQTGEPDYHTAVDHFFDMVVPHRMYSHGGTGQGEVFRARDSIAGTIVTDTNAESCACYNMLKVAKNLFFHSGDPKYMDFYERGLVNQILASRRNVESTTDPMVTYMVPVGPGARRGYGNTGTCCGGTGLENHTKYQESVYFRSADDSTLYVNLYLASTLDWGERGFTITQTTSYPEEGATQLRVDGSGPLEIKLRVPAWVQRGFEVSVNGR